MKKAYFVVLILLLLLFASGCMDNSDMTKGEPMPSDISSQKNSKGGFMNVNTDTVVVDVINHPAFEGFGRFLFPTEYRMPDKGMKLNEIGLLLPYHNNINSATTVNIINYMMDEVKDGETIFYDYYTERQKQDDPDKENTGLFFFRGDPNAPFAIICPGGGFSYVGSIHEGFPHALELSKKGYNAFVIQYRVGGADVACEDLAAAISYIFENAEALRVSTKDYSVWGSSAGARMAAYIGSYGTGAFAGTKLPKPSTVVMAYTGHSDYTTEDPPTFVVVGERDGIANPSTMQRRINALKSSRINTEYHKYPDLGHGFGLGIGTSAEGWLNDAVLFWEKQMSN
jgi:acetyl esterase/lipase